MQVMVSYSSQDWEVVERFAKALRENDVSVWLDKWMIRYGSDILQEVEQGVGDAEFLLLMLSPSSIESGWVQKEWRAKFSEELKQKRTKVICVRLEECKIPLLLASKKYIDANKDPERAARELADDIKRQSNDRINAPIFNLWERLVNRVAGQKETPFTDVKQTFEALGITADQPKLAFECLILLLRNKELTYELSIARIDDPAKGKMESRNVDTPRGEIMQLAYQARRVEVESKLSQVKEIVATIKTLSESLDDGPNDAFNVLWRAIVNRSEVENQDVESNRRLREQESANHAGKA